jgi:hypothetical protein
VSQAEALLLLQLYGAHERAARIEPLRRLMLSMLTDVVRGFQTNFDAHQRTRPKEFAEAQLRLMCTEG